MDEFEFDDEVSPKEKCTASPALWPQSNFTPTKRPGYGSNKNRHRLKNFGGAADESATQYPEASSVSNENVTPTFSKQHNEPPSSGFSSIAASTGSSPLVRGRTAKRRTRKIIRTGAEALQEAQELSFDDQSQSTAGEKSRLSSAEEKENENNRNPSSNESSSDNSSSDEGPNPYIKKKRSFLDVLNDQPKCETNENEVKEESPDDLVLQDVKVNVEPSKANIASSKKNESKVVDDLPQSAPRGRRRKRKNTATSKGATPNSLFTWNEEDEHDFSSYEDNASFMSQSAAELSKGSKQSTNGDVTLFSPATSVGTNRQREEFHEAGTPADSIPPSSSDSKSVRFSLSSNTSHFYEIHPKDYGTPPGSPDDICESGSRDLNVEVLDDCREKFDKSKCDSDVDDVIERIINQSASKSSSAGLQTEEDDDFDDLQFTPDVKGGSPRDDAQTPSKAESLSNVRINGESTVDKAKSDFCQSNFQESTPCIAQTPVKKLPPSCLRSKRKRTNDIPNGANGSNLSTPDTSPSDKSALSIPSNGSSISRISGTLKRKKHRSRRFNLDHSQLSGSETSANAESSVPDSPEPTPTVAVGRPGFSMDASDAQDAGNVKMFIDDLSYLCSAIIQCRKKLPGKVNVACEHTPITAGAACDLAEIVSVVNNRKALLSLGSSLSQRSVGKNGGSSVGALGAVLEAISCAPPLIDCSNICRDIIDGTSEAAGKIPVVKMPGIVKNLVSETSIASNLVPVVIGGTCRTKSARRKRSDDDCERTSDSSCKLEERDEFDEISSKALSIISHFVGLDSTGSERSGISSRASNGRLNVKAARKGILQHRSALQGIARLVADDPVVHAYLRRASCRHQQCDDEDIHNIATNHYGQPSDDEGSCGSLDNLSSQKSDVRTSLVAEKISHNTPTDPTKSGRRKSRKKKQSQTQRIVDSLHDGEPSFQVLDTILEVDNSAETPITAETQRSVFNLNGGIRNHMDKHHPEETPLQSRTLFREQNINGSGKSNCLDFSSEDGNSGTGESQNLKNSEFGRAEKVELKSGLKYKEKISLAISRSKLTQGMTHENSVENNSASMGERCFFCEESSSRMILLSSEISSGNSKFISPSNLALDAADCIISGRDKESSSSGDDNEAELNEEDEDTEDDFLEINSSERTSNDDLMSKNPMLYANEMIRKSGSLPIYSQAMSGTLAAMLLAFKDSFKSEHSKQERCSKCMSYLQKRASSLSVIIDNLCCLSPEVSKMLSHPESMLVPGLLRLVAELSFTEEHDESFYESESVLIALKTLTSLTHENSIACEQIVRFNNWNISLPVSKSERMIRADECHLSGVEIIFSRLFITASQKGESQLQHDDNARYQLREKFLYDTTIFCLNILTNIVEMVPRSTVEMFSSMEINDQFCHCLNIDKNQRSGLSWLSNWVVSQTSGFRQEVMKGSFGRETDASTLEKPTSSTEDNDTLELKEGEEGNLVICGNGFILLASLMLEDAKTSSTTVKDVVLSKLPTDRESRSGGIQFMIKTLKAFCNFYHYSVGDLSVAVIAPVVKLIRGLERIELLDRSSS